MMKKVGGRYPIYFVILCLLQVFFAFAALPIDVKAADISCGDTITEATTLTTPLNCSSDFVLNVQADLTLEADITTTGNGLVIGAENITINGNGHMISGDNNRAQPEYGIDNLSGYANLSVVNFELIEHFAAGVNLGSAIDNTIQGNTIRSNFVGITSSGSSGTIINNDNQIEYNTTGISFEGDVSTNIAYNTIRYNKTGLSFGYADSGIISNNNISRNNSPTANQSQSPQRHIPAMYSSTIQPYRC